ncbi:MAG: transglycosylase SLT domain-containing protein, partial [Muribaculaceae bacterium]|nr:transglycosylase SLT domain-containing protein [Muribaculaceae bacterium]
RRYYELSKQLPDADSDNTGVPQGAMLGRGRISQYDEIFKRYAKEINWDWRLLAAQAYNESHFDVNVVSWAGARGLMQLMPRTASAMGLPAGQITDPELNVKAAVKVIAELDKLFKPKVQDREERIKFIVAAYNSGQAHVLDAITIAGKSGHNPKVWSGEVEQALLLKSNPQFYRDPDVKYGYFKGTQTVDYVKRVMNTYAAYKAKIPL